jgi:hypothetical protein
MKLLKGMDKNETIFNTSFDCDKQNRTSAIQKNLTGMQRNILGPDRSIAARVILNRAIRAITESRVIPSETTQRLRFDSSSATRGKYHLIQPYRESAYFSVVTNQGPIVSHTKSINCPALRGSCIDCGHTKTINWSISSRFVLIRGETWSTDSDGFNGWQTEGDKRCHRR